MTAAVGAALLAILAAGAFLVGVIGYVLGSYVIARASHGRRPLGDVARSAFREAALAVLVQPLLPLYYLVGRRMARGEGDPVVVVHGYFQNRACFLGMARALGAAGLGPVYGFNYPWTASIVANAARLARFVEAVCEETGKPRVSLVAHSMGGLVALEYVCDGAGQRRVRRCVTIASPHAGVSFRGPIFGASGPELRQGGPFLVERIERRLAVPTLSVFSLHDNVVHPHATSALAARGGTDLPVEGLGHLAILFDQRVQQEVVAFLRLPDPTLLP